MATGTGKTVTAIAGLTYLAQNLSLRLRSSLTIVICPYLHLVDQWSQNFRDHKWDVLEACEGKDKWLVQAVSKIRHLQSTPGTSGVIVTTIATFRGEAFQNLLKRLIGVDLVVACDEAHNFGSKSLRGLLPEYAQYRLGLSATPDRWMDVEGTTYLQSYFRGTVFSLGIQEAIQREILVPYEYFPRICKLDALETSSYVDVTIAIGEVLKGREFYELNENESTRAGILLRERSAILGTALDKQTRFLEDFAANRDQLYQLVYCSQGSSPVRPGMGRHIEYVQHELNHLGISAPTYEASTSRTERLRILERFEAGEISAILSMKCLDEGVDIPRAHISYFIASGTNPKEFVQRRGRVLRRSPGKTKAVIYDYFAYPLVSPGGMFEEIERGILKRELDRALELAECAINMSEAKSILEGIAKND